MKITEFEKTLQGIKIPSNIKIEQRAQLCEPLIKIVEDLMPSRLYRFRQCSERNFTAFYEDQVWVSRGTDMNDDFDACLYCDNSKIVDWLDSFYDTENNLKIFDYIKVVQNVPQEIQQFFPNAEIFINALRQLTPEDVKKVSFEFKKYIKANLPESIKRITTLIQNGIKFACFSQDVESAMMWGHYAENGTGFALGYDFRNGNLNDCSKCSKLGHECFYLMLCHIYPVIYKDERYDATDYVIYMFQHELLIDIMNKCGVAISQQWREQIVPCPDIQMPSKIAIHKSLEWKSEKEWRLFCTNANPSFINETHFFMRKKPVAVYLGRKISAINEKILRDIAREKGIECYKMAMNNSSQGYVLGAIKQEL